MSLSRGKRMLILLAIILFVLLGIGAIYFSPINLQPETQRGADYVGSINCSECHEDIYEKQSASMHTKMIQDVSENLSVIVADFS